MTGVSVLRRRGGLKKKNLLQEGALPGVQLDNFDTREYFIGQLDTLVLQQFFNYNYYFKMYVKTLNVPCFASGSFEGSSCAWQSRH